MSESFVTTEDVGLFVTPDVDEDLACRVVAAMPIWMPNVGKNGSTIQRLRKQLSPEQDDWITSFDVAKSLPPLELALGYFDMLQLHHWKMIRLHVFGLSDAEMKNPAWSAAGLDLLSSSSGHGVFACPPISHE